MKGLRDEELDVPELLKELLLRIEEEDSAELDVPELLAPEEEETAELDTPELLREEEAKELDTPELLPKEEDSAEELLIPSLLLWGSPDDDGRSLLEVPDSEDCVGSLPVPLSLLQESRKHKHRTAKKKKLRFPDGLRRRKKGERRLSCIDFPGCLWFSPK